MSDFFAILLLICAVSEASASTMTLQEARWTRCNLKGKCVVIQMKDAGLTPFAPQYFVRDIKLSVYNPNHYDKPALTMTAERGMWFDKTDRWLLQNAKFDKTAKTGHDYSYDPDQQTFKIIF